MNQRFITMADCTVPCEIYQKIALSDGRTNQPMRSFVFDFQGGKADKYWRKNNALLRLSEFDKKMTLSFTKVKIKIYFSRFLIFCSYSVPQLQVYFWQRTWCRRCFFYNMLLFVKD